jgi:hypothetical protein
MLIPLPCEVVRWRLVICLGQERGVRGWDELELELRGWSVSRL